MDDNEVVTTEQTNGAPSAPELKLCSSCRTAKPEDGFYPSGWSAKSAQCKACITNRQKTPGKKSRTVANDISQLFGTSPSDNLTKEIVELVILQRGRFDLAVIEAVLKDRR